LGIFYSGHIEALRYLFPSPLNAKQTIRDL
jgi:hypothetical protein